MTVNQNYIRIRNHIDQIAVNCGRDPRDITLIAVSKRFPWDHARGAFEAGCTSFGENNVQEALGKMACASEEVQWHLIGTLQRKKVNKVIGKFSLIHSVDSLALAKKISTRSFEEGLRSHILLQVNISCEESKSGFTEEELFANLSELASLEGVVIEGLMTIAPRTDNQEAVRQSFKGLRVCFDKINRLAPNNIKMKHLSMGMTEDYAIAIEEGATLLRIGSGIFGDRNLS